MIASLSTLTPRQVPTKAKRTGKRTEHFPKPSFVQQIGDEFCFLSDNRLRYRNFVSIAAHISQISHSNLFATFDATIASPLLLYKYIGRFLFAALFSLYCIHLRNHLSNSSTYSFSLRSFEHSTFLEFHSIGNRTAPIKRYNKIK